MASRIRIRQVKSVSGTVQSMRATLLALGLRRINHTVEHGDTPQIRGMIFKVRHLVEVAEIKG
jgi:large subunit ribosomal protein L30